MKILLGSHHFHPGTGGIETVSAILAAEFVREGHEVRVVTQTAGAGVYPYSVVRQPTPGALVAAVRWCDVFLQNNISLRTLWPLLFIRRPLFVIHQTWIAAPDGSQGRTHALKRFVLRAARSFSISKAIAKSLPVPSTIVGNPYNDAIFKLDTNASRDGDLVFVGRLVSDKGVDVLLDALGILRTRGATPRLMIVGDGPEREALQAQAARLELGGQVTWEGALAAAAIAPVLNRHKILVVPSRWAEPFGIVAVEGIACGCVVIGSSAGGLPEAIGPCGITFPNGDAHALADAIESLLADETRRTAMSAAAGAHLAQFSAVKVARTYLDAMAEALR